MTVSVVLLIPVTKRRGSTRGLGARDCALRVPLPYYPSHVRLARSSACAPPALFPAGLKHVVFGWRCAPACRGARTLPQSHASSPIVLAGPSQISTAPRWLPTAKYVRPGAEALGPPVPRHQFLAGTLHQRAHPCRGRPFDAIPHDARDRNEEASFHRLASCGTPRFGALEHACGQSWGSRPLSAAIRILWDVL